MGNHQRITQPNPEENLIMELIDRYLNAVKFWLPKAQQDDIIAELSEDVRSQVADRETELGRKLNEPEVEDLLKQLGRPVLVANRYLPQQSLIGPVLFPIYLFTLKIVMACWIVTWILAWICSMSFNPAYRETHSGSTFLAALGSFWGAFWSASFVSVGIVTIVFAVLERTQANAKLLETWEPRKLPPVRDPRRIPRGSSIAELVGSAIFLTWWLSANWSDTVLQFSAVKLTFEPAWLYFWWGFLLLTLVNIAVSAANLFRPSWTRFRASLRLLTDCAGSMLFCWALKSAFFAAISLPNVSPAKAREITNAINFWMSRSFPFAVAVGVFIVLVDIYRIIRIKETARRLTNDVRAV